MTETDNLLIQMHSAPWQAGMGPTLVDESSTRSVVCCPMRKLLGFTLSMALVAAVAAYLVWTQERPWRITCRTAHHPRRE
jgi:hypothetical protein